MKAGTENGKTRYGTVYRTAQYRMARHKTQHGTVWYSKKIPGKEKGTLYLGTPILSLRVSIEA